MRTCGPLVVGASLIALVGCGDSEGPIESMTLYALDGNDSPAPDKPLKGERFHGFGVVGKADIASPADRLAILRAVKQGIARSDGTENKCFWPHHGFRMVQDGKQIDYVICFHCRQLVRHMDGAGKTIPITDSPAATLDAQLAKAGVPLHVDQAATE
jgi:hypothetical protein